MTEKNSHSSRFITEMRRKLLAEQALLRQELATLGHTEGGGTVADYPDYGRGDEDNATESADFQALAATTQVQKDRLAEVEAALARIEEGTYGLTADGELIAEDRLRANPAATTMITGRKE